MENGTQKAPQPVLYGLIVKPFSVCVRTRSWVTRWNEVLENPAPEGRTRLARRFSAGKSRKNDSSPGGTTQFSRILSRAVNIFVGARLLSLSLALACGPPVAQTSPQGAPLPSEKQSASPAPATVRESGNPSATSNVNSADLKTEHAVADSSRLPKIVPSGRPVIGVALEGGGALGLAHIGVLQWMEDNHIPVDRIAGTSMGALIGGLYASGHSPAEMQQIATSDVFRGVFAIRTPYMDASFRRREDRAELPQAIRFGLKGGLSLRNALLVDSGLNEFLRANFDRYNRKELSYDGLPISFRCVATDLNTLQPVAFDGGPMPQAVRASVAIPGIFSPVQYRDHYLVDGGIMDNLPTDIVKEDLHSDVVIAVHFAAPKFSEADVSSVVGVLARAFSAGTARNERLSTVLADVLISIDTSKFSTTDYNKASDLIAAGYEAAEKNRAALKKYALDDAGWTAYIADRGARERPKPSALRIVKVEGHTLGRPSPRAGQRLLSGQRRDVCPGRAVPVRQDAGAWP